MEQVIDIRIPEKFQEFDGDDIMLNFDRAVVEETAIAIKGEELFSRYAGWNFNGMVWWQDEKWHCEVWQYRSYMETVSEDTLDEIMITVSDKYGYE